MPDKATSGSPPLDVGGDDVVRVFMSYRRSDDANFTGRFHDKLIGTFGEANVFRDIDSIPAGTRFEDVITDHLNGVDAVLAMIGPTWAGRIDSPNDFVHMEIAQALQSGTPVIPVLIEETPLPTHDALPDDLQPLLDRHTVRVRRDPDFHRDAARVVEGIREAVNSHRLRTAELRRVEQESEEQRRAQAEVEAAREARRREIEAELDRVAARADDERRAAELLETERLTRQAELARLEEEATQRRINDERARLAAIVESQAQRERDAAAAERRAAELRKELAGLPDSTAIGRSAAVVIDDLGNDGRPAVASESSKRAADDSEATITSAVSTNTSPDTSTNSSTTRAPDAVTAASTSGGGTSDVESTTEAGETAQRRLVPGMSGRRTLPSASTLELVGMLLLVIAFIWGARAQFYVDADDTTAFSGGWGWDVAAVVLTAALLAPLLVFFLGGQVPPWVAGTSIGFLTFQGFPLAVWFWRNWGDEEFPTHMIAIGVLLAGAWLAFRLGRRPVRATIDHRPSRWLQIGAAAAVVVTVYFFFDRIDSYNDYLPRAAFLYLATGVVMLVLSTRRTVEPTLTVAVLAATCAVSFLADAVENDSWLRGRSWNVAAAAIVLSVTAFWRAHRGRHITGSPSAFRGADPSDRDVA